jgi:hypothetical protein
VSTVAEHGGVLAVFAEDGATVFSAGAVATTDRTLRGWQQAGTIVGTDGSAKWLVGIDGDGRLRYLHGISRFEDVSPRFGLEGDRVRAVASLDERRVAFLLGQEIAVADGHRVTRYATGPLRSLEGGGGKAVAVGQDALVVFDGAGLAAKTYALPGVRQAVVGNDGRVYAATSRAIFASAKDGDLSLLFDAQKETLHGLVASGTHVWFADGGELGLVQGDHVAESKGAGAPEDAALLSSPSGDVWVLAHGQLQRFRTVEDQAGAAASTWSSTLAPVFARSCAACHLPNGVSGTDLSTATAWQGERDAIRRRVVVTRSMPPEGHPLSEADRAAIAAWVSASR